MATCSKCGARGPKVETIEMTDSRTGKSSGAICNKCWDETMRKLEAVLKKSTAKSK